jgi:hypothetical protein
MDLSWCQALLRAIFGPRERHLQDLQDQLAPQQHQVQEKNYPNILESPNSSPWLSLARKGQQ